MSEPAIQLIRPGAFNDMDGPTEESIAREFVHIHGNSLKFDHGIKRWFYWNGTRWRADDLNLTYHRIGEHLRAVPLPEKSRSSKAGIARSGTARGVESFAMSNPLVAVGHDLWNNDPWLLGTPAGTVDLRTGTMSSANPADYITQSTSVAPSSETPKRWLKFIDEATAHDADLAQFLQSWMGYSLTGSTREQKLAFGYGDGGNGKGVFTTAIERIMGDYAVTAAMDTFTASRGDRHPTELARLDGARLVIASETQEGRSWDEAKVKQLTGGDRIAARFISKDFFEFTPRFKLFIIGNFKPRLHSVDPATRRRFNIVPFIHKPATPDPRLEEKLADEYPQILGWMIEGARRWYGGGLKAPAAVTDATERYFSDQDTLGQFIAGRCLVNASQNGRAGDLFKAWAAFAKESGESEGTQRAFGDALEKRGFERARINALGRIFRGIDARSRQDEVMSHVGT